MLLMYELMYNLLLLRAVALKRNANFTPFIFRLFLIYFFSERARWGEDYMLVQYSFIHYTVVLKILSQLYQSCWLRHVSDVNLC